MNPAGATTIPGDWHPGTIPANAAIEDGAHVETSHSFLLHRSRRPTSVRIGRGASVYQGTMFDLGPRATVAVGRFALLNGAWIISDGAVEIGDYALIAWNVVIMDTYRAALDPEARRRQLRHTARIHRLARPAAPAPRPVVIGRNVWIGFDSCILPGVRIGADAVVGARSVVTDDVPARAVVAGNPARLIRRLEPDREGRHAAAQG